MFRNGVSAFVQHSSVKLPNSFHSILAFSTFNFHTFLVPLSYIPHSSIAFSYFILWKFVFSFFEFISYSHAFILSYFHTFICSYFRTFILSRKIWGNCGQSVVSVEVDLECFGRFGTQIGEVLSRLGLTLGSLEVDSERLECILMHLREVSGGSGGGVVSVQVE